MILNMQVGRIPPFVFLVALARQSNKQRKPSISELYTPGALGTFRAVLCPPSFQSVPVRGLVPFFRSEPLHNFLGRRGGGAVAVSRHLPPTHRAWSAGPWNVAPPSPMGPNAVWNSSMLAQRAVGAQPVGPLRVERHLRAHRRAWLHGKEKEEDVKDREACTSHAYELTSFRRAPWSRCRATPVVRKQGSLTARHARQGRMILGPQSPQVP